ncbi:hypothetical protein CAEBREN_10978 [Caenorhabditis brenneri]|uniref:Uncharacterized protein n=1 Tax=Caenorhabditis brenneri TaxID=135651 RepID=G0PJS7_CAEBE|nr:hypothetical protein CAEBREN_10978 [Caenorhabditis brenneri]
MSTLQFFLLFCISYGFSIMLASEACAFPNGKLTQQDPVKLGDFPKEGEDIVHPKDKLTVTTDGTPPVANSVEQIGNSEGNSNSRYQPTTIFSAILTLILCKMI